jgi:hypothetical protein
MRIRSLLALPLVLFITRVTFAQKRPGREIYAQRLIRVLVDAHPNELAAAELALLSGKAACRTVAATHREDIGEQCDDDEWGPIRHGTPNIEEPTPKDTIFDVTQVLHDKSGRVIGALGLDVKPSAARDREALLALVTTLRAELEARIPSAASLTKRE